MALKQNQYGGIDLLATAKHVEERLTALEEKVFPPAEGNPTVTERVDKMLAEAYSHAPEAPPESKEPEHGDQDSQPGA